jgi:hypothetical protein
MGKLEKKSNSSGGVRSNASGVPDALSRARAVKAAKATADAARRAAGGAAFKEKCDTERAAAAADDGSVSDGSASDADAGSAASVASVDTRVDDIVPAPRFQQVVVAREGVIAEHSCGKREKCLLCGALVWKEEDRNQLCCGRGKYILGPDLNAPIAKEERAILSRAGMSRDSRIINNALAMGCISTEPSRERGGEGFVETGRGAPGGLSLHGKTYCATYGINNVGGLNVYSQPENLILDAASSTGGVGYSLNLGAWLKYINEHHPLAQRFASVRNYDAAGGTVLNIDDHLRIGSGTGPTFKMEIAAVMPLHEEARDYRVHVWDIKSAKSSSVSNLSVNYERLLYPCLMPHGIGGWYVKNKAGVGPKSTSGAPFTLFKYAGAMLYHGTTERRTRRTASFDVALRDRARA